MQDDYFSTQRPKGVTQVGDELQKFRGFSIQEVNEAEESKTPQANQHGQNLFSIKEEPSGNRLKLGQVDNTVKAR